MSTRTFGGVFVAVAACAGTAVAQPPSFTGIGDLPGGSTLSNCYGISRDGSVVVGGSASADSGTSQESCTWVRGRLPSPILALPGGELAGGLFSGRAVGASTDGSVVAGVSFTTDTLFHAYRWVAPGPAVDLGDLSGGTGTSRTFGLSDDGLVVVGEAREPVLGGGFISHAFRWSGGVMSDLGELSGGATSAIARGCSADGSVVVGQSTSASGPEAFRWTSGPGMAGLGDATGGDFNSDARAVTPDGSIIVGTATTGAGTEAFIHSHGIMRTLGGIPGAGVSSHARAVSADGRIIVGIIQPPSAGGPPPLPQAGIWTQRDGWRVLPAYLTSLGLGPAVSGWFFTEATGISGDGTTIVGLGFGPGNVTEGWVAVIPRYCPTDWNADGVLTPADVAAYVNAWVVSLTGGTLAADFDLDNSVVPADVASFVSVWFAALPGGC